MNPALASPAVVVGMPVGFVGAVDAKAALRASGLPSVSNRSEKGGAAVAAAANALLYDGTGLHTEARTHEPATEPASPRYLGCLEFLAFLQCLSYLGRLGCRRHGGFVART